MCREKKYGNYQLNKKKLEKLKEIFSNIDEIDTLSIYTKRKVKENGITEIKSQTFNSFDKMIDYINKNSIVKIDLININLWYKKDRNISLEYDGFEHIWILKYQEKDSYTDAILYNLDNLFKHKIIKCNPSYLIMLNGLIAFCYLAISSSFKFKNDYFASVYLIVSAILFILILLNNKSAYKENRFIEKNKDSIILSVVFYILGLVSPYIIKLIQDMLK